MKENGLAAKLVIKGKRDYSKSKTSNFESNILAIDLSPCKPNASWVSDVTAIKINNHFFHVCVVLDLFSRAVVDFHTSSCNNTNLITNAFRHAYDSRNEPKDLLFHSDQGSNYMSHEFTGLLNILGVTKSISRKGNPYDNACMESLFSHMKAEETKRRDYQTYQELKESIINYIKFYNEQRPHKSLGYLTPLQYEEKYHKDCEFKTSA